MMVYKTQNRPHWWNWGRSNGWPMQPITTTVNYCSWATAPYLLVASFENSHPLTYQTNADMQIIYFLAYLPTLLPVLMLRKNLSKEYKPASPC